MAIRPGVSGVFYGVLNQGTPDRRNDALMLRLKPAWGAGVGGQPMDEETFKDCLSHADLMLDLYGRQNYWMGYRRGLRRAFYGDAFCTEQEHQLWLSLIHRPQWEVAERGRGYLDGLRAIGTEDEEKPADSGDSNPLRIVLERSNPRRE